MQQIIVSLTESDFYDIRTLRKLIHAVKLCRRDKPPRQHNKCHRKAHEPMGIAAQINVAILGIRHEFALLCRGQKGNSVLIQKERGEYVASQSP